MTGLWLVNSLLITSVHSIGYRMTECARCGDCCDPVNFTMSPGEITAKLADPYLAGINRQSLEFANTHWHLIRRGEYKCDYFNADTRLCTAHDKRPPICSRYPWYEDEPKLTGTGAYLSPRCSYNADVRNMLPIVQINGLDTPRGMV
jgi:Fe-S-cluster containining protein